MTPIEVLSQVIADAFFPLAPCQWLIPDPAARRDILPGYFRMYVEHAMADGLVHTTPGRDAAVAIGWRAAGGAGESRGLSACCLGLLVASRSTRRDHAATPSWLAAS